jgi:type IV pilus assembly protein PilV
MSARRYARRRGSTIVEVMMALAMLAVGISGLIALQKVTSVANRDARKLEVANQIARTWIERLRADALLWNYGAASSDLGAETVWLTGRVQLPGAEAWFRPENQVLKIYGVHDGFGMDDQTGNRDGPYCVNLRLQWLYGTLDDGLVRAEVRVYWLRQGIQSSAVQGTLSMQVPTPLCGAAPNAPPAVDSAMDVFHLVHVATALAKNNPK